MSLSVLLSDPNHSFQKELASWLKENRFDVEIASNGKDAQLKLSKIKYYALLIDFETTRNTAFEVLKYARINSPNMRILFSFPNKDTLKELGLSLQDLPRLGINEVLFKPYKKEELIQKIEGNGQSQLWKKIETTGTVSEEEEVHSSDKDFTRISIQEFFSGNVTVFDLYVRLGSNRYLKILQQGDVFEKSRIEKYTKKGVEYLYFKTKERALYINFINSTLENALKIKHTITPEVIHIAKSLTEKYIEEIHVSGLKPQLVEEGKKVCENLYGIVNKSPALSSYLKEWENLDPSAMSHTFLTSLFSFIIAKNLQWVNPVTLNHIGMGALLHDIGMLKIPPEVRGLSIHDDMTPAQLEIFKKHPGLGIDMLSNLPEISEQVKQIVFQHHELANGMGFPNKLSSMRIFPLAKVVCLASEFADYITKKHLKPIDGLKDLIPKPEFTSRYDPLCIKAFVKGFSR